MWENRFLISKEFQSCFLGKANISMRDPKKKMYAGTCMGIMAISLVWACGPMFPDWLLTRGDLEVGRPPTTHLRKEIQGVLGGTTSLYRAVHAEKGHAEQTLDVALKDLHAALLSQSMPSQKMEAVLRDHQSSRKIIRKHRGAMEDWARSSAPWLQQPTQAPVFTAPAVTAHLPDEFVRYFRGSIAYYQKKNALAGEIWRDLLALPADDRHYRSTWAAFMLGKLALEEEPKKAIAYFHSVREMVDLGFSDSLGLAAASLGWEARVYFKQKDYRRAIELYLEQMTTGNDVSAYTSIRWVLGQAFRDEDPERLRPMVQSAEVRRVATAYLTSPDPFGWGPDDLGENRRLRDWVEAIESVEVDDPSLFEVLALAVYQRGFYDLSQRLLDRAPRDGFLSLWLRSKLLFRRGHVQEATDLLARVVRGGALLAANANAQGNGNASPASLKKVNQGVRQTALSKGFDRLRGEHGVLQLHRGAFVEALDALLRSGYWMDAAYLAERILTLDELKKYVDRNWPSDEQGKDLDTMETFLRWRGSVWSGAFSEAGLGCNLRYLLARRLLRMNRPAEARAYYPAPWRVMHDQRMRDLERGRDTSLEPGLRVEALRAAAQTTRHHGLELIGTECAPDWAIHGGDYTDGLTMEHRQDKWEHKLLAPLEEEIQRATETRLDPFRRFHYRYLAADIAWEALEMMPDNTPETARYLCEVGAWIKYQDPSFANRFYKALVQRCSETPIGRAAKQLRWFPKLTADGELVADHAHPFDPREEP
jgi:hypothetical protein